MTTKKLVLLLFLGILLLAGVVTAEDNSTSTESPTTAQSTESPDTKQTTIITQGTTPNQDGGICPGFDGPSFIGGIVLTWGLGLLLWLGMKFYQTRKESNYNTL